MDKLHRACKAGNEKVVAGILASSTDLDIDKAGNDGKTALYHTINERGVNTTRQLLEHNVNTQKSSFISYHRDRSSVQLIACDEPPVVTAARVGSVEIMQLLLEHDVNPDAQSDCHSHISGVKAKDKTALHFACEHQNVQMVSLLLENGADVNIEDRQNELPIHIAVRCKVCPEQNEIVKMLCERGSDVNLPNKIACPPLYLAAFYGCLTKVQMLILYGADPNNLCERESSYGSALHIASLKDRLPLAELLIENNVQLNRVNGSSYTPLQLNMTAHNRSAIASLLIYHGADMSGRDKYEYTLMASCIRTIRLDCESLARLMVYAGYDLNPDHWLRPIDVQSQLLEEGEDIPNISIPSGRVQQLCDWLHQQQTNTLSLLDLCRISIRKELCDANGGRSIVPAIGKLPLPTAIKDFLLLSEFM